MPDWLLDAILGIANLDVLAWVGWMIWRDVCGPTPDRLLVDPRRGLECPGRHRRDAGDSERVETGEVTKALS